jgi:Protein of unknown function (DUF3237)
VSIELIPFGRFVGEMGQVEMVADTPVGRRYIVGVRNARFVGSRFQAWQRGTSAADWMLLTSDSTAHIDVRLVVKTDDGAFVYASYRGRADWTDGPERARALCVFTFETGAIAYTWLNSAVIVGRAIGGTSGPDYELFELR